MFGNRIEAGKLLAKKLEKFKNTNTIILGIPRGGIPVAYSVAKELSLPLEVILTKKIGHPLNKEYAIGATSLKDYIITPHEDVTDEYIQIEIAAVRSNLKEMQYKYTGNGAPLQLKGKTVVVIDDGIATGNTILETILIIKKSCPLKIIVAVPVASRSSIKKLSKEATKIIVLESPEEFYGVGSFYESFDQVTDEEVIEFLKNREKNN